MRLAMMIPAAILLAFPAAAQDWAVRATDERFDAPALEAAVTGRTLRFYDDGQSKFSAGGAYSYTYSAANGGGSQFGTWTAAPEGIICIAYRNGMSRCDMYVMADGRLVVLTAEGGRFPTRPED